MFFHVSRFPARLSGTQEWLNLERQDRNLWDRTFIAEGVYYLNGASKSLIPCKFYLEVLISSVHSLSTDFNQTDWEKISSLYRLLEMLEPDSPLIRLNRIISESYLTNPSSLIPELELMETTLTGKHKFVLLTTKAHLYERARDTHEAIKLYQQSLKYANSKLDEFYILGKLNEYIGG